MTPVDRLIVNAHIVTMAPDDAILKNGYIAITGDQISGIGEMSGAVRYQALEILDARGGIAMPGLVNTHTHLPMSLFRGLADDLALMTWLNEHMFPAEARHIHPETVETGAALSCAEMLLCGTTTVCDGYFYEAHTAAAVHRAGMRAVLAQGVIDFPAPGVPDPTANVALASQFVEQLKGRYPLITPSIFCHSPYTCSADTLKQAKQAARAHGVLFQIHIAETRTEWDRFQAEHHLTPIQYLHQLGILDQHTLLVHAVWSDERDIGIIVDTGAAISHNPESNMKLAAGIAPVTRYVAAGIPTGLGTDSCASNNNLDLFSEMDVAAKLQKVSLLDPTALPARDVLRMATIEGARAIGLADQIGSLEIGKKADMIIIDMDQPHVTPMYSAVSHLVYAVSGRDVAHVFINGRPVVVHRRVLTMDVAGIRAKATAISRMIRP